MKLHTVFVTHNRLELTKRTIESFVETSSWPHDFVVIDNCSTDGTKEWLKENVRFYVSFSDNRYPGAATNYGFEMAPEDATHLHRSDNDVEYKPGWCDEVEARFEDERLWQLGLRTLEEEGPHAAVGGNCVFARAAWESGIRYSYDPWTKVAFEDANIAHQILRKGYVWERVQTPCIEHIGIASRDDPYYRKTFAERNITFEQYGL